MSGKHAWGYTLAIIGIAIVGKVAGAVEVFELIGHPKTHRVYAWAHEAESGKRRHVQCFTIEMAAKAKDQTVSEWIRSTVDNAMQQ